MKKSLFYGMVVGGVVAVSITSSVFASIKNCVGERNLYPNLDTVKSDEYPVACPIKVGDERLYAKTASDCAQAGVIASDKDACDLEEEDSSDIVWSIGNNTSKEDISVGMIVSISALSVAVLLNIIFITLMATRKKKDVVPQNTQPVANVEPTPTSNPTPNDNQ